jgi:hypothetical protein
MEIDELEAVRDLYEREIVRIEGIGARPEFGVTAAQVSHLVDKLKSMRDE